MPSDSDNRLMIKKTPIMIPKIVSQERKERIFKLRTAILKYSRVLANIDCVLLIPPLAEKRLIKLAAESSSLVDYPAIFDEDPLTPISADVRIVSYDQ